MTRTERPRFASWGAALLLFCAACGDSAGLSRSAGAPDENNGAEGQASRCYGANDCPPGYQCNEFNYCSPLPTGDGGVASDGSTAAPEVEEDREQPQSGERYVYVAIASQGMVVKIDSKDLTVRTVKVGDNPGALRTVGGKDVALLLNRNDATASLLRSKEDGSDEIVTLPTVSGLNQLAVAPDGRFAVAFFEVSGSPEGLPDRSFQEVTLLRLDERKAVDLSVGFRPSGVQYSLDGEQAFVITEQGVSIIDLQKTTKPAIVPTVSYYLDPLSEPEPSEVRVTPDGELALLRSSGVKGIRAVDLATGAIDDLPLPEVPSDLDLTPDGELALLVLRETRQLALVELSSITDPTPSTVQILQSDHPVGQATLTADGKRAFVFTNATDDEVLLTVDLATREMTAHLLEKAVRAVRPSPGGGTAVVLHNKEPGTPSPSDDLDAFIDKHEGYSLIDVSSGFVKLQLTDAPVGPSAFDPEGRAAYLLLADPLAGIRLVEAVDLDTFLVSRVALGSDPASVGVVPATSQVYVAQSHPLGRVTFIDQETHQTRTLTGFALNSQVIE